MVVDGAHAIIFSRDAEADRAFLRDIVGLPSVDAGEGWLIFALPPSELAVHPSDENNLHRFYFTCADLNKFISAVTEKGATCSEIEGQAWGLAVEVDLPGGGTLGVYEPRHPRP